MEAMACGAYRWYPTSRPIWNGCETEEGWAFQDGNPESLAERILEISRSRDTAARSMVNWLIKSPAGRQLEGQLRKRGNLRKMVG
jgi:hypothetical protein